MVNYCAVPGCKTNRKNHEKCTTFHVPNDPVIREEWRKIIGVEFLEEKHRICRKHFSKQDVVSSTDFFDSSGNFITTLPLKLPKLQKDAKPRFALNGSNDSESNLENNLENTSNNVNDLVNKNIEKADNNENNLLEENNVNDFVQNTEEIEIDESIIKTEKQPINTTENLLDVGTQSVNENSENLVYEMVIQFSENYDSIKKEYSQREDTYLDNFIKFCSKLNEINLPDNCYLNYSEENGYITLFEICASKFSEDNTSAIVRKSLFINIKLEIQYSILSKAVEAELFNLKTNVQDINELEIVFKKFINMNICIGIADLQDVDLVADKISYTDTLGVLRHRRCNLLSINQKCYVCARVRKTIYQKKVRMGKRNIEIRKPPDLYNSNECYLKKIYIQRKIINRINLRVKKLKGDLKKVKEVMRKTNLDQVLNICLKREIPDLQKNLLRQILSSTQSNHPNGHRFDNSWLSSCVSLYTQYPNEYQQIQNLNLLPLPCVRTIKRYISFKTTSLCHENDGTCGLLFHTYSKQLP